MSEHPTDFQGSVTDAIREAILGTIRDADVEVSGGGGHYTIVVTSPIFAGKNRVAAQRLVYGAIAHLMAGDRAPVHAVDSLRTLTPS
jgi:acid stress-induced BolA-like protein IbaG/YrbA